MPRISRAQIDAVLERFCRVFQLRKATDPGDGGYYMDHYPAGGGWRVEYRGGSSNPFGNMRHGGAQMMSHLSFAAGVMEHIQYGQAIGATAPVKPTSMYEAKVIAAAKRVVAALEKNGGCTCPAGQALHYTTCPSIGGGILRISEDDVRTLRHWVGQ